MIKKCNSFRQCEMCPNIIPDTMPNNARTCSKECSQELKNQRHMDWYYKDKVRKRKKSLTRGVPRPHLMADDPKCGTPYKITEKELKQFKKAYVEAGIAVYKKGVRIL